MDRNTLFENFLKNNKCKVGVEIGTYEGSFAKHICSVWPGDLYCIDPWRELPSEQYTDISNSGTSYSKCIQNLKGFEDRCFMIRMLSEQAHSLFEDNSLDFVYIDANHAYSFVKHDLSLWWPKLKKGGLFSGHDFLAIDWWSDPHFLDNKIDKHVYSWNETLKKSVYLGVFGVNPAVEEFCDSIGYSFETTSEWFGTWYFVK